MPTPPTDGPEAAHPADDPSSAGTGNRVLAAAVLACAAGAGVVLTAHSRTLHFGYEFSAYDVGMHLQALWKLAHLRGLFNTVRGLPYWGDHLWIASALLAPVYRVWPSPTVAYAYQGFGLAAGGVAVYGLARAHLRSRALALVPPVLYWCYPGLIYTAQENFHPEAIASTWLLVVLWAHETERPRLFWAAVALALLTKEDVGLYLLGFAVWFWMRGARRRAVGLGLASAAYVGVAVGVLLPFFNGVGFFRASGNYWFSDWARHALEPSFYVARLMRPDVRTYLVDLFWPVAWLPLLHPVALALLAGPALFVNLAGGAYLVSVHYHYLYGIIPGVFLTVILALATLEGLATRARLTGWLRRLAGTGLALVVLFPTLRFQWTHRFVYDSYPGMARRLRSPVAARPGQRALLANVLARVPPDAVVSATHDLVPFLANRDAIYMFPNPWQARYWGIAGENPASPATIDMLVLNTGALAPDLRRYARRLARDGTWEILTDDEEILVARRRGG